MFHRFREKLHASPVKRFKIPWSSDPYVHCYGTWTWPTTGGCHDCLARMFFRLDLKNWSRVVLRKRQQDILCVRLSRVHTKTWPSITTLTANHAQPTVSDSQNGSCGGILHKLRERQSQNMPKRKQLGGWSRRDASQGNEQLSTLKYYARRLLGTCPWPA